MRSSLRIEDTLGAGRCGLAGRAPLRAASSEEDEPVRGDSLVVLRRLGRVARRKGGDIDPSDRDARQAPPFRAG